MARVDLMPVIEAGHEGRAAGGDRCAWAPPAADTSTGLLGLLGAEWRVWAMERQTRLQLRSLACQRQLVEAEAQTARAVLGAREEVYRAAIASEEVAADLAFRRELARVPRSHRFEIVGAEVETERMLLERERLRHQRLAGNLALDTGAASALPAARPAPETPAVPSPRAIEPHYTDKDIDAMALRAVTRVGSLAPEKAEQFWRDWEREAASRLPSMVAAEAIRRAHELASMAGEHG